MTTYKNILSHDILEEANYEDHLRSEYEQKRMLWQQSLMQNQAATGMLGSYQSGLSAVNSKNVYSTSIGTTLTSQVSVTLATSEDIKRVEEKLDALIKIVADMREIGKQDDLFRVMEDAKDS